MVTMLGVSQIVTKTKRAGSSILSSVSRGMSIHSDPEVVTSEQGETVPKRREIIPEQPRTVPKPQKSTPKPQGSASKPQESIPEPQGRVSKQEETIPVQQKVIPVQQETISVQQEFIPVRQKTIPAQQETIIEQQEVIPVKQEATPELRQEVIPERQETIPELRREIVPERRETIPEVRQEIIPERRETIPELRREIIPERRETIPERQETIPKCQEIIPELGDATAEPRYTTAGPSSRATAEDTSLFQHSDWYDRPDQGLDLNLAAAQTGNWKRWTVKLEFTQQGSRRTGTAFYINLAQKSGRILLTAGHNLISEDGEIVQDMKISETGEVITPANIFISKIYRNKPCSDSKVDDYGMILLPGRPQGGFGFSLKVAEASSSDMRQIGVNIIGYHQIINEPDFYSGRIDQVAPKYLKYNIQSVPGNSGGPVWIGSEGREIAIGIHNYGGDKKKKKSPAQGTRIHLGVLEDICRWTAGTGCNVGYLSKRLAVCGLKPPHDKYPDPELTFYMKFTRGVRTAKARLGAEELETTFDVLPGLTPSCAVGPNGFQKSLTPARYVFRFKEWTAWQENSDDEGEDTGGRRVAPTNSEPKPQWVRWRTDKDIDRVELSERIRDDSLVELQDKAKGFQIIQGQRKLRMMVDEVDQMPPEGPEGLYELYESERVGFIPAKDKHTENLYCLFRFA
ncbi:hypothetical protein TWF102_011661 [Orbilia oligospora]|uniref:Serine protease n=1 Tax=Orbilia oligospora TaxID=2813651 RepID=A0A7C8N9I3_ORBOL|nr:hypothetical protein TWF102_011661 [Orbilia oligospora]KAF3100254.1 hypothetical protein TWF103_008275 [Orbilia oligospora]